VGPEDGEVTLSGRKYRSTISNLSLFPPFPFPILPPQPLTRRPEAADDEFPAAAAKKAFPPPSFSPLLRQDCQTRYDKQFNVDHDGKSDDHFSSLFLSFLHYFPPMFKVPLQRMSTFKSRDARKGPFLFFPHLPRIGKRTWQKWPSQIRTDIPSLLFLLPFSLVSLKGIADRLHKRLP